MFYAKLALVLLLVIPVAVLGFFLLEKLLNQALERAKRDRDDRMEREQIDNSKARSSRRTGQTQKR